LDWHQRLIARKYEGSAKRSPRRPSTPREVRGLILRMAAENRTWGYTRILGALQNLGHEIGCGTIAHWLGHASVNTTNKYISVDLEAKCETLAKAKPLLEGEHHSGKWRRDPDLMAWLTAL
jgi:hypothetical protein